MTALFPGTKIDTDQEQATPGAANEPLFKGEKVDTETWYDQAGDWMGEKAGEAGTAVLEFGKEMVNNLTDWVTRKTSEDYPEIASYYGHQVADTPIGMLNVLKRHNELIKSQGKKGHELELDVDRFGTPVVRVDGEPHYFNRPGPSLNDYDWLIKGFQSLGPLIVGGTVAAPAKLATGSLITGASGAVGELLSQMGAEAAGADEGYDLAKIGLTGAYAAGGEATGRLLMAAVGGVFHKLFGKQTDISKYFDGEKFTDEGLRLLKQNDVSPEMLSKMMTDEMKRTGVLTAEQAKRYNKFIEQGIKPTKAQITQSADDFRLQQQGIKSEAGKGMRADLDVQNAQILSKTDELASKAGGNTMSQSETGTTLVDFVTNIALAADRKVSKLYDEVRAAAPQAKNVQLSGLVDSIRKNMGFNTMSKGALRSIWSDLKMRGVISADGKLQGKVSVDTAHEIRKVMNTVWGEGNPTAKRLMTDLKDALDDDVFKAAGKDIYKRAREAKSAFHKMFTDAKGHKLDTRSKNVLEKLYNGEITPDKAYRRIVKNGPVKDLQRVKQALHSGTPEEQIAGKQVWDNLRSQVIRDAIESATKGGRNEMGDVVFSMKPFANTIKHYQNTGKLRTLFSDAEITQLRALIEVGEMRIPIVGTALGEGPTSGAVQKFAQAIFNRFRWAPGVRATEGVYGKAMQFADEAAEKAAMEAARQPAQATTEAITTGVRDVSRAASLPARAGGFGGLMLLGEQRANSQEQRRGQQR